VDDVITEDALECAVPIPGKDPPIPSRAALKPTAVVAVRGVGIAAIEKWLKRSWAIIVVCVGRPRMIRRRKLLRRKKLLAEEAIGL